MFAARRGRLLPWAPKVKENEPFTFEPDEGMGRASRAENEPLIVFPPRASADPGGIGFEWHDGENVCRIWAGFHG
jgi:hypothetical protein